MWLPGSKGFMWPHPPAVGKGTLAHWRQKHAAAPKPLPWLFKKKTKTKKQTKKTMVDTQKIMCKES